MAKKPGRSVLCIGSDAVNLNLRCALLKREGWTVFSSCTGHEGIISFGQEAVDAVVVDLNDDGAEAALITGELKRLRPDIPVVILVPEGRALANGATKQADAVVVKSKEALTLVDALKGLFSEQ